MCTISCHRKVRAGFSPQGRGEEDSDDLMRANLLPYDHRPDVYENDPANRSDHENPATRC